MLNAKQKHLSGRFSLRFLLGVAVVAASCFAYLRHQEMRRQATIETIRRAGGSVTFGLGFSFFRGQRVESVALPQDSLRSITNADLREFPNLEQVVVMDIIAVVAHSDYQRTLLGIPYCPISMDNIEILDHIRNGSDISADSDTERRHRGYWW